MDDFSRDATHEALRYAIGGENVTVLLTGRERYPVGVRYPRDLRDDVQAVGRVLVTAAGGREHIPIAQVATIQTTSGPAVLRNNEDGLLPILWSTGTGSDVMKRIAAPMIGGIVTPFVLELIVYPAVRRSFRSRRL